MVLQGSSFFLWQTVQHSGCLAPQASGYSVPVAVLPMTNLLLVSCTLLSTNLADWWFGQKWASLLGRCSDTSLPELCVYYWCVQGGKITHISHECQKTTTTTTSHQLHQTLLGFTPVSVQVILNNFAINLPSIYSEPIKCQLSSLGSLRGTVPTIEKFTT